MLYSVFITFTYEIKIMRLVVQEATECGALGGLFSPVFEKRVAFIMLTLLKKAIAG